MLRKGLTENHLGVDASPADEFLPGRSLEDFLNLANGGNGK
jgi:hypothetical protein